MGEILDRDPMRQNVFDKQNEKYKSNGYRWPEVYPTCSRCEAAYNQNEQHPILQKEELVKRMNVLWNTKKHGCAQSSGSEAAQPPGLHHHQGNASAAAPPQEMQHPASEQAVEDITKLKERCEDLEQAVKALGPHQEEAVEEAVELLTKKNSKLEARMHELENAVAELRARIPPDPV